MNTKQTLAVRIQAFAKKGSDYVVEARELALETLEHTQTHNDWDMLTTFCRALNSEGLKAAFIDWAMTFSPTYFYQIGEQWRAVKNKQENAPSWNIAAAKSKPFDLFQVKAAPKMLDAKGFAEKIASLIKSAEGKLSKASLGRDDMVKEGEEAAIRTMLEGLRKALPSTGNVTKEEELADLKADIIAKPLRSNGQRMSKEAAQSVMATH